MSPWTILQLLARMYFTKRDELFLWLGLRHEDPFLESQFQLYFYNSQRIVSIVCCICAFVFCGGGTIIWSETINVLFVLWDAFAVLVWAMCACILFWLYRRHLQLLRELERCASIVEDDDDIMLDSNGDTTLASSRGTTFRLSILGNRSQSPQHTASTTTKEQSAARFARNATVSASSSRRVQRLEEELQWNTTWHERFLMVANGASVWFTVGLNGAQGSCDYVPVDRRILDCRNAINTESLLILFISASVFLMQVRMFVAWPLFFLWAGAVIAVLQIAVPDIVSTYFAAETFLVVFELCVAAGTLCVREWKRRADFEHFVKRQERAANVNAVRIETQRMLTVQLPTNVMRSLMIADKQQQRRKNHNNGSSNVLPLIPWVAAKNAVVCHFDVFGIGSTCSGWASRRSAIEVTEVMRRVFEALDGVREVYDADLVTSTNASSDEPSHAVAMMHNEEQSRMMNISKYHCFGDAYVVVREVPEISHFTASSPTAISQKKKSSNHERSSSTYSCSTYRTWLPAATAGKVRTSGSQTPSTRISSSSSSLFTDDAWLLCYSLHSAAVATRVLRRFFAHSEAWRCPKTTITSANNNNNVVRATTVQPQQIAGLPEAEEAARLFQIAQAQRRKWLQQSVFVRCGMGVGPVDGVFCRGSKTVSLYGQAHDDAISTLRCGGDRPRILQQRFQHHSNNNTETTPSNSNSTSSNVRAAGSPGGSHGMMNGSGPSPLLWGGLGLTDEDCERESIANDLLRAEGRRTIVLGADVRVSSHWFRHVSDSMMTTTNNAAKDHPTQVVLHALRASRGEGAIVTGIRSLLTTTTLDHEVSDVQQKVKQAKLTRALPPGLPQFQSPKSFKGKAGLAHWQQEEEFHQQRDGGREDDGCGASGGRQEPGYSVRATTSSTNATNRLYSMEEDSKEVVLSCMQLAMLKGQLATLTKCVGATPRRTSSCAVPVVIPLSFGAAQTNSTGSMSALHGVASGVGNESSAADFSVAEGSVDQLASPKLQRREEEESSAFAVEVVTNRLNGRVDVSVVNATTTSIAEASPYSTALTSTLFVFRWFVDRRTEGAYQSFSTHSATKVDVMWTASSSFLSLTCLFATLTESALWGENISCVALITVGWACCVVLCAVANLLSPPRVTSLLTSHMAVGGYPEFCRQWLQASKAKSNATKNNDDSFRQHCWRVLDSPIPFLEQTSLRTVIYFLL